jgi:hypothetical protein
VALLREIANPEQGEGAEYQDRNQEQIERLVIDDPDAQKQPRDDSADRHDDEARRERKHQRFHGIPPADSAVLLFFGRSLIQTLDQPVHDIRRTGHGYDSHQASQSADRESIHRPAAY